MLLALLSLAAETAGEEPSKAAFYLLGGLLVLFALGLAAVGIRRHETFPASAGTGRALMALCAVLVAAAMAAAVLTA
jgi:MYXO-CTERM domain-containing protein